MASACGAGLMLMPVLLGMSMSANHSHSHGDHSAHLDSAGIGTLSQGILAVFVHTLGHLLAAGAVAFLVYDLLGVAVLRKAWINLDLIWVGALVLAGLVVIFV